MRSKSLVTLLGIGVCVVLLGSPAAAETKNVTLSGFEEVPVVITDASGHFRTLIARDESAIQYELAYTGVGSVTQAHIHIAQPGVNGAIVLWLCSNLASPPTPPGTQPCPPPPATISGGLTPADVQTVVAQGIAAGELGDVIGAIRNGLAYVNVHSTTSPGGVIRGQFSGGGHH
jgi:CHRD domain